LAASFVFTTPGGADVITIDSPAAGQNRISGTSGGTPFESITFRNVASVTIDAGTNDTGASQDDTITFVGNLVALGLTNLTLSTGDGNDQVSFAQLGTTGSVQITVGGGTGTDELVGPVQNSLWTITGLNAGTLGTAVTFTNVENLTSGEGGVDSFLFLPAGKLSGTVEGRVNDLDRITVQIQADNSNAKRLAHVATTETAGSVRSTVGSGAEETIVSYSGIQPPVHLAVLGT